MLNLGICPSSFPLLNVGPFLLPVPFDFSDRSVSTTIDMKKDLGLVRQKEMNSYSSYWIAGRYCVGGMDSLNTKTIDIWGLDYYILPKIGYSTQVTCSWSLLRDRAMTGGRRENEAHSGEHCGRLCLGMEEIKVS